VATTDELRDRADWMLDTDPMKLLSALDAVLGLADELAKDRTGRFFAEEICNRIGPALDIQEGGTGDAL
jgi:hypothetical protein